MKRSIYFISSITMIIFLIACAVDKRVSAPSKVDGSIIAEAQWPRDLSSELSTVRMTVFSNDMEPRVQYFRISDVPETLFGVHGILAGENREVSIEGLSSSSERLYTGYAKGITVVPDEVVNSGVVIMSPVEGKLAGIRSPQKLEGIAGDGQITIKWSHVSGAENYNIYMNKNAGVSKKNFDARKMTDRNRYTWDEIINGKTYYFVVTAESGSGESSESIEIELTPGGAVADEKVAAKSKAVVPIPVSKEAVGVGAGTEAALATEKKAGKPKKPQPKKAEQEKTVKKIVPSKTAVEKGTEKKGLAGIQLNQMTPQQILEEVDLIKAPNENFTVDMKLSFQSGNKKSVNEVSLRVRDFRKSLVIYKYPATQKGRVLLMVDSNMWIYFPGTKRSIRISPQQQLLGQVSNADVARAVFNLDYSAEKLEENVINNEKMLIMSLKAKTEGAAYGNIKIWIKKDGIRPIRAEFYTLTGRLLKTIYYKNYQNILGRQRPTLYEVHDAIKKSDISTMEYTKWRLEDTPDSYFQKTFMQRVGRLNL